MSVLKFIITIIFICAYDECDGYNEDDYHLAEVDYDTPEDPNTVDVYVYYETFNPNCESLFIEQLDPIFSTMLEYIRIHLNPCGSASIFVLNGKFVTSCKQGKNQCHGNKLHACALQVINNNTKSALYNSCLMRMGSTDEAADKCGQIMGGIKLDSIKRCAHSDEADIILDVYRTYTKVEPYPAVPFVLVKNKRSFPSNLLQDICAAFEIPPPPCRSIIDNLPITSTTTTSTRAFPVVSTSVGYTFMSSKQWLAMLLPTIFLYYYCLLS